jgi:hypothetical protein
MAPAAFTREGLVQGSGWQVSDRTLNQGLFYSSCSQGRGEIERDEREREREMDAHVYKCVNTIKPVS